MRNRGESCLFFWSHYFCCRLATLRCRFCTMYVYNPKVNEDSRRQERPLHFSPSTWKQKGRSKMCLSFKIWQSPRQAGAFLYLSPPPWGQEAEILLVLLFSGLRIAGGSRELWCMADYGHTLKPDWLSRFIVSRLDASVVVWMVSAIQQWKQSSLCSSELSLLNVPD